MEVTMFYGGRNDSESRFSSYVEGLTSVIGHADRAGPLPKKNWRIGPG
jgi:hypothetical protein